jgi:hypothetical protein
MEGAAAFGLTSLPQNYTICLFLVAEPVFHVKTTVALHT